MDRHDFLTGARIAFATKSIEKVADYFEILRLNEISKNAWERGNNSGNAIYKARQDRKDSNAWNKANKIAHKNKWTLEAPGLYWIIKDENGNELR